MLTKPVIAQSVVHPLVTIAVKKATWAVNATLRRRRNPAIAVPKSATSPVIVPILAQVREQPVDLVVVVLVLAATAVVVEAGRSATNAARSGTLLVIAPRMAGVEEDTKLREAMAVEEVAMEVAMEVVVHVKVVKPVTHAAVTVTCLAIALKARSATTVSRASFRKIWNQTFLYRAILWLTER